MVCSSPWEWAGGGGRQISWHSRGYHIPCLLNRGWTGASAGGGTTAETL